MNKKGNRFRIIVDFKSTPNEPLDLQARSCLVKRPKPEEANWSLWDGERSWHVGKLSMEEQMKYPLEIITNDTGLIHKIETGRGPGGFEKLC